MPIIFALMIVMIWAQVISWIYAVITPFMKEMWEIQNYNRAYYGAIASVERAELVLRKHTAWFEGSWWVINKTTYWPNSDYDFVNKKYFWLLGMTWNNYGIFWQIKNLSKSWVIPEAWKWDLDPDISSWNNFYRLPIFYNSLQVALYKDESNKTKYYTWYSSLTNIIPSSSFDVQIRVPQKICHKFNNDIDCSNNTSDGLDDITDLDRDGITNDIIVNRSLFWYTWNQQFTIFPTTSISWDNSVNDDDTNIREDVINQWNNNYNIKFNINGSDTNPIEESNPAHNQNISKFNQSPEDLIATWFDNVFSNNVTKLHAKFSAVNLLKYSEDKIYPYLEIKVKNNNWAIPDKYFYITWEWKVGKYDVRIKISKPVFETTAASDFTVLF